jgi:hypothetical protein
LPPIYEDRPNPANRRCISWNGEVFGDNADALLLVAVTPEWQLEKAVGMAADQFAPVTVPGADSAVARLSQQQYFDGGGQKVKEQRTTDLQVVVQSGPATYTFDGSFAPGKAGEAVAAALLGSIVVH